MFTRTHSVLDVLILSLCEFLPSVYCVTLRHSDIFKMLDNSVLVSTHPGDIRALFNGLYLRVYWCFS